MSGLVQRNNPLHGVRIWLSGAIPEEGDPLYASATRTFVAHFAERVFQAGGHILHGSHPTITPILLAEARKYIAKGGKKDCLTLAVSKLWSKNTKAVPVQEWRQTCMVYETPEVTGHSSRKDSLGILRQYMAERCDSFIAVGGMWWREVEGTAGVPIEAHLAIERNLPCFLLGGFGGAANDFVKSHPEVLRLLRNGLDEATNSALALSVDIGDIVHTVLDQLSRLPLVRGRVSDGISFRILALDGGGVKGAFTASALATIESALGLSVVDHFDLIAGTSTGGIISLALGMGASTQDMVNFYRDRGPVVFPMLRFYKRWYRHALHIFTNKHSHQKLREELDRAYFPDGNRKTLNDSLCRLVVPAYDAVSGVCHVFRTPHNPLLTGDASADAVDVALATAAAPTYFSPAVVRNKISEALFFDGGVWANCPAMAAIVEAVCYLHVPLDRIDVLSIGTTDEPFTVKKMTWGGWAVWNKTLISLLTNAQVDSSVRHAQLLVGEPRFLRLNTLTAPGEYTLDGAQQINNLISLGYRRASDPEMLYQVKSRFLNGVPAFNWKE